MLRLMDNPNYLEPLECLRLLEGFVVQAAAFFFGAVRKMNAHLTRTE